ncbi:uroporphyrinogen III decarboxylase [Candidatus Hydrogenisulfobacillus filiaventi]|uniref:Uroporphyrinogen decarboxylase n=1 Tax=Candidatus Hydrogenisulfobacillus filiaventi TaxID=2707344 RepID=A0A6F8ZDB5_9FIRM|nr:uroporphyrinogen III decarboxylase [Candidatus Hydrogenisulfobacillus filiaventi]
MHSPEPQSRFLRACRGLPVDTTPVWFMRQAGRYQPEYRALRQRYSILDLIRDPALAAEVTCLAVEQLEVDAAILFSDIVVPLMAMGAPVTLEEGRGPVVRPPFRSREDLERLAPLEPERQLPEVAEAVRLAVRRLHGIPLIGFAGAPFTLASYLIEGGHSALYLETKRLMWGEPDLWAALMARLVQATVAHLAAQIEAGAAAVQVFDSWVGALAPADYRRAVLPYMRRIFDALAMYEVPRIYFGVGTATLLEAMAEAGADVVGVDWRIPLDEARRRLGDRAVQGNLDPAALLAPWPVLTDQAQAVLTANGGQPGHIFNLGHGVLPATNPGRLHDLVRWVHERGAGQ